MRIDHFRGFESYWAVPSDENTARNGQWDPGPGDALFHAVQGAMTDGKGALPIVAEDLGVITPEADQLRDNHCLPGMVVLQFEVGNSDFDIATINANSVCYTGTHDNDTTLGWFLGNGDDTRSVDEIQRNQAGALQQTNGSFKTIVQDMIQLAFSTNATLAMVPMQDYLGLGSQARLNTPGTSIDNWGWRMLPDQLQPQVIEAVRGLLRKYQRNHTEGIPEH